MKIAVEKLKMMNVVGPLQRMDSVIGDILKSHTVNFVPAQQEMEHNAFTFSLEDDENVKKTLELNKITEVKRSRQGKEIHREATEIMDFFNVKEVDEEYMKEMPLSSFHTFYEEVHSQMEKLEKILVEDEKLDKLAKNYELFKNVEVDLSKLQDLTYFDVRYGTLDKDGRYRLKKNYGNVLAMIYHTGTVEGREIYLAIFPKEAAQEIDRILRSLNWQEVEIPLEYKGTAEEVLNRFSKTRKDLERQKKEVEGYRQEMLTNHREEIESYIGAMLLFEKVEEVKEMMINSPTFFYLSGWIGVSDISEMKKRLSKYPGLTVDFREPGDQEGKPPTKLKNFTIFRPFEMLIKMYGTPNYKEVDPTFFFGITYLILFGAMFGDLGQGAVFLLGGLFLLKLKGLAFGALMIPMGISSMIFGLLYGSVFGNEEILPALWMKPFENIEDILVIAVGFGVILIIISYILGLINKLKQGELEEGLFGKEGFAGFVLYLSMLNVGLSFVERNPIPIRITNVLIGIFLLTLIFSKPLTQKLEGKKVNYDSNATDYYVEGVFSIVEALLSIVSNIISFIRVGAFAINHVGLFLAFRTMGRMIGNKPGNILVLIIGNIIIIGLEGLIVFIQSLRLEYYEMFSKYYRGDGYEFIADRIERKI
ncbi:MAG: V-type ATPase 116kDa subunit family protein [Tissierellia bacterium]|nr:V-type ATPase 116kDa subunit family protein [Tissierellia bacterium]